MFKKRFYFACFAIVFGSINSGQPVIAAQSSLIRAPYLQNVAQDSVKVLWSDTATTGKLYWGAVSGVYSDSASSIVVADNDGNQIHTATITGLATSQKVYYYVKSGAVTEGYGDSTYYAVAAPSGDASFRFVAYGDSKYSSATPPTYHGYVVQAMLPHEPDMVIHCGDIAEQGRLWEFIKYYFDFAAPLIKNTPVFTTMGNHEFPYNPAGYSYEADAKNYRDLFDLPVNSANGTEDYYSFDYGSVHFVCLNTQRLMNWGQQVEYYDAAYNSAMKTWFTADLAATTKPWKVVFFHKQAFLNYVENKYWRSVFEENGVQAVFFGHGHVYNSHYRNGVTYITTGGGGASIGSPENWAWPDYRLKGFADHHFVQVDVTPEQLALKIYDDENALRHWIDIYPDSIAYPKPEIVEDFEIFDNTADLQGTWALKNVPAQYEEIGVSIENGLAVGAGADTGKAMRLDFSFPAGSEGAWGAVGLAGSWDWSIHKGIRFWLKDSITGDPDQFFQARMDEAQDGDQWVATWPVGDIDSSGEYCSLFFNKFELYGAGNPDSPLADGVLDLESISALYVGASASPTTANENSTSTIWVDNISVLMDYIYATHLDDDFETYPDNATMEQKWNTGPWWGGNNSFEPAGMSMEARLDPTNGSNDSQALRLKLTFNAGISPNSQTALGANWEPCVYGIMGSITDPENRTDLSGYAGVRFWIKPGDVTGEDLMYFKLNLIEDGATGGDKWMSPKTYLRDLDPEGQYVYISFDDYYEYFNGSSQPMNRSSIRLSYLWLAYDDYTSKSSSATVWIDDIQYLETQLSVINENPNLPDKFTLYQNYPNPFNPVTTIRFDMPEAANVQLTVYDILGREVITLVDGFLGAGHHSAHWDGRDRFRRAAATGIYICRLQAGRDTMVRKIALLK